MTFAKNLKSKLTATTLALGLTLAGAFGAAAPATAQDASAQENIQNAALQVPLQRLTAEEARARSSGKIVLHYGEGYSLSDLQSLERVIEEDLHIEVDLLPGGPEDQIQFYFFTNDIGTYNFDNSTEIAVLSRMFAEQYNLGKFTVASNDVDPA